MAELDQVIEVIRQNSEITTQQTPHQGRHTINNRLSGRHANLKSKLAKIHSWYRRSEPAVIRKPSMLPQIQAALQSQNKSQLNENQ